MKLKFKPRSLGRCSSTHVSIIQRCRSFENQKAVYSITADEKTLERMTTPTMDKKAYAAVRVSSFPEGITDKQIASAVDQFILMSVPFQDARSMMELLLKASAEG